MRNLRGYAGVLCAALLIAPVSESLAGKPGGGVPPPPDCSSSSPSWSGFPSFAYLLRNATSGTYEVRVASQNGLCSKRVGDPHSGAADYLSFAANDHYVLAWRDLNVGIYVMSFELGGSLETVSTIPALTTQVFRTSCCGSLDLSADASSLAYVSAQPPPAENELRIATLVDETGASDQVAYRFKGSEYRLWWAPWGRIYVHEANATDGRRLRSIDPGLVQAPTTLLTLPSDLKVGQMFSFGPISGGYSAFGESGALVPAVVFQGYYATKVRGSTGDWCTAVYALDADSHEFVLGSLASPSSIGGFTPSVTQRGTVLVENVTGTKCVRTGEFSEWSLSGATPSIIGKIPGTSPAALKRLSGGTP